MLSNPVYRKAWLRSKSWLRYGTRAYPEGYMECPSLALRYTTVLFCSDTMRRTNGTYDDTHRDCSKW